MTRPLDAAGDGAGAGGGCYGSYLYARPWLKHPSVGGQIDFDVVDCCYDFLGQRNFRNRTSAPPLTDRLTCGRWHKRPSSLRRWSHGSRDRRIEVVGVAAAVGQV